MIMALKLELKLSSSSYRLLISCEAEWGKKEEEIREKKPDKENTTSRQNIPWRNEVHNEDKHQQ